MNTPTPLQKLDDRRQWRKNQWARRNRSAHWLIDETLHQANITNTTFVKPPRPARCGWPLGKPIIQLIGQSASMKNLEHCASPWCCPICTPIIRAKRAKDLQAAATAWTAEEHSLILITLTRPHTKTESLAINMDMITGAWADITASQRWRDIKSMYGIAHWVKSLEITWSLHAGWHVHLHLLAFITPSCTHINRLHSELTDLWNNALRRQRSRSASKRHGVDVRSVTHTPDKACRYISKSPDSIGSEITRMDNKKARSKSSLNPFQLLDQSIISQLGEPKTRSLWLEYAHATAGQRSMTWSRQLRAELLGTPDQTDQQIIDDTITGYDVIDLTASTYRHLKLDPSTLAFILSRVETGEIPLALGLIAQTV